MMLSEESQSNSRSYVKYPSPRFL